MHLPTPRAGFASPGARHYFSSISAYTLNAEYNVAGAGASDRAYGSSVSTNLFDTLGVRPALGRFFTPQEEESGQDRVVVLVTATGSNTLAVIRMCWGRIFCSMGSIARLLGSPRKASSFPTQKRSFGFPSLSRPATPRISGPTLTTAP